MVPQAVVSKVECPITFEPKLRRKRSLDSLSVYYQFFFLFQQ